MKREYLTTFKDFIRESALHPKLLRVKVLFLMYEMSTLNIMSSSK